MDQRWQQLNFRRSAASSRSMRRPPRTPRLPASTTSSCSTPTASRPRRRSSASTRPRTPPRPRRSSGVSATGGTGARHAQLEPPRPTTSASAATRCTARRQPGFTPSAATRIAYVTAHHATPTPASRPAPIATAWSRRTTPATRAPRRPRPPRPPPATRRRPTVARSPRPPPGTTGAGLVTLTASAATTSASSASSSGSMARTSAWRTRPRRTPSVGHDDGDARVRTRSPRSRATRPATRTTSPAVTVTVDNSAPAGPSPVAAYSFDDGDRARPLGGRHGRGHTGAIREATWAAAGRNGKALQFDGVNDWVTIDDAADLRLSSAMTLEAWINPSKVDGWRTAIMKERTGDLAYALYSSGPGQAERLRHQRLGAGEPALTANTWSHLAATYDGATIRHLCQRRPDGDRGRGERPRGQQRAAAPRWQRHLGRVLRGQARRRPRLRPGADRGPDPDRHELPGRDAGAGGHDRPVGGAGRRRDGRAGTRHARLGRRRPTMWASPGYAVIARPRPGSRRAAANRIAYVASGTSYTDSGLAPGTYFYRVIAEDAAGNAGTASARGLRGLTGRHHAALAPSPGSPSLRAWTG